MDGGAKRTRTYLQRFLGTPARLFRAPNPDIKDWQTPDTGSPPASSPAVRKTMQGNRSRDTKPELAVRKMLRSAGFPGYRIHWRIDDSEGRYICRPDICYPGRKIAIFVHGCFWHRCPNCKPSMPKTNIEYWKPKFERNVERDRSKQEKLVNLGWDVKTVWECELDSMDAKSMIGKD